MTTAVIQRRHRRWLPDKADVQPLVANIGLIVSGCIVFVYGMHAVMIPAGLFGGGLSGLAVLANYWFPQIDIGSAYLAFNVPLAILGWRTISRQFMGYTFFGMFFFSFAALVFHPPVVVLDDPLLAALSAGVICGLGSGLILRSLGSAGGLDILGIYLNRKYGFRIGTLLFAGNGVVILAGVFIRDLPSALYSLMVIFVSSVVLNKVTTGFNIRKAVLIVSDHSKTIADAVLQNTGRGVTFLDGQGAFTGNPKKVIFTVTTLTDLPKLKELVTMLDPNAFMVINDTLEVFGGSSLGRLQGN